MEHFGSDAGYRAMFIRFPDQHFAVACLCNGGPDTQPRELTHQITDLFLAKDYKPSTKLQNPPQLKPEQLKAFAGAYWNASANEVRTIIVKRGVLQVLVGEDLISLHPLAPETFGLANLPVELHFFGRPATKREEFESFRSLQDPRRSNYYRRLRCNGMLFTNTLAIM